MADLLLHFGVWNFIMFYRMGLGTRCTSNMLNRRNEKRNKEYECGRISPFSREETNIIKKWLTNTYVIGMILLSMFLCCLSAGAANDGRIRTQVTGTSSSLSKAVQHANRSASIISGKKVGYATVSTRKVKNNGVWTVTKVIEYKTE